MASIPQIVAAVEALSGKHVVVGISGFGGSGKSTLARTLAASIPSSARIRGDDFLDPTRSHTRSEDWDGMERLRLRAEVLEPFRAGRSGTFRRFDWAVGALGAAEPIPDARVLIVDAVGLFHPEVDGVFDLAIWVDVDLAEATARGKLRDRELGRDHDALWDLEWVPTERAFAERYGPRERAHLRFDN
jgi:uridine kinase